MEQSFDKGRPATTLEHLIDDYREPDHDRDAEHHREFHSICFPAPADEFEYRWRATWEQRVPIHHHTWVHDTFAELVNWICANTAPFSGVWSHPTLPDHGEFYFRLTK